MNSKLDETNGNIYLTVICTKEIGLVATPYCPERSFRYDNCTYVDQGFGDLTGFYDWLRNTEGRVIGGRYLPVEELDFLCEALVKLSYVLVDWRIKSIDLYFSGDRGVDDSISNDQEFGDIRLFRSDAGTFALSFNASLVSEFFDSEVASKVCSSEF